MVCYVKCVPFENVKPGERIGIGYIKARMYLMRILGKKSGDLEVGALMKNTKKLEDTLYVKNGIDAAFEEYTKEIRICQEKLNAESMRLDRADIVKEMRANGEYLELSFTCPFYNAQTKKCGLEKAVSASLELSGPIVF